MLRKFWSNRLTTKLRLLVDACVIEPLHSQIKTLASRTAIIISIHDTELGQNATDDEVVAYATKHDYIVVTTDKGMNEKRFRICTHPGIIILGGKSRHSDVQSGHFRRFLLSGHRRKANHAVTYLTQDQARIVQKSGDKEFVETFSV